MQTVRRKQQALARNEYRLPTFGYRNVDRKNMVKPLISEYSHVHQAAASILTRNTCVYQIQNDAM